MRLLLLRFHAEIRVARVTFSSRAPRVVVSLRPEREGRRRRRTSKGGFRLGCLRLFWSRRRRRWRDPPASAASREISRARPGRCAHADFGGQIVPARLFPARAQPRCREASHRRRALCIRCRVIAPGDRRPPTI